jgi:hypothetical protein
MKSSNSWTKKRRKSSFHTGFKEMTENNEYHGALEGNPRNEDSADRFKYIVDE